MTDTQVLKTSPKQRKEYGLMKWSTPRTITKTEEERRPKDSSESEDEDEEIERDLAELHTYLQCRLWEEGGNIWVQYASTEPATREEVVKIADKLDEVLIENGARETGICDVRSSIYSELFDELIRQEAVACGPRGKLLAEMRDTLKRTLQEYSDLYSSSTAYGIQKVIQVEETLNNIENEKQGLKLKLEKLNTDLSQITEKYDEIEKQYEEIHKLNEEKHNLTVEYFTENNKILKDHLISFLIPKK